jgi:hypothetical protein
VKNSQAAELLALKPAFDEVFEQWWRRHLDWERRVRGRAPAPYRMTRATGLETPRNRSRQVGDHLSRNNA